MIAERHDGPRAAVGVVLWCPLPSLTDWSGNGWAGRSATKGAL